MESAPIIGLSERIADARSNRLSVLNLAGCDLDSVPLEVFELEALEFLNLSNNRLTDIPDAITSLKRLRQVNAERNRLSEFPICLLKLPALRDLNLGKNQIARTPEGILERELPLDFLLLYENELRKIPWFVSMAPLLRVADFSRNRIEDCNLAELRNLKQLEVFLLTENPCVERLKRRHKTSDIVEIIRPKSVLGRLLNRIRLQRT